MNYYHYSRLTDREIDQVKSEGLITPRMESFVFRLQWAVEDGYLDRCTAKILRKMIENKAHIQARLNGKVWFSTQRIKPASHSVNLLLGKWGGEVMHDAAYAADGMTEGSIVNQLKAIGRGVILRVQGIEGLFDELTSDIWNAGELNGDVRVPANVPSKHIADCFVEGSAEFAIFGVSN